MKNGYEMKKAYIVWDRMMKHSSPKYVQTDHMCPPSKVCKEWRSFQNFAKWYEYYHAKWDNINDYGSLILDSSLLSPREMLCSPTTSLLIPIYLAEFLADKYKYKDSGNIGAIRTYNKNNPFRAYIKDLRGKLDYLGSFETKEGAAEAYNTARLKYAAEWRDKMTGILPQEAIENIK